MKRHSKAALLCAALAALLFAACAQDGGDAGTTPGTETPSTPGSSTAYTGTYKIEPAFSDVIVAMVEEAGHGELIDPDVVSQITLTIEEKNTAILTVPAVPDVLEIPVSYSTNGTQITFREFQVQEDDIKGIAEAVFSGLLNQPFTYANGTLTGPFGTDGASIDCFTKN